MQESAVKKVPKLRFPGFSDEWTSLIINNIATKVGSGSTPKGGSTVYKTSGIVFVRSQNVSGGRLNLEDAVFIDNKTHQSMKSTTVKPKDILLNITGASLGRACVVPTDFKEGNVNQHVCIIRLKNNFSPKLVQELLDSPKGLHELLKAQTGGGKEGLNFQAVRAFKLSLPADEEQEKIAGFLSVVDEQIELIEKKLELSKKYKKGLIQKLFPKKGQTNPNLRFKKDDGSFFSEWQTIPLSKFLVQKIRAVDTPNESYLGLGVRSHFKGLMQRPNSDPSKIMMNTLYVVKDSDLVVNITFAWEGAVAIADSRDDGGLVSHRFPTYRFNEDVLQCEFFRHVFPSKKFKYGLGLASPGGAGRNRVLSKKEFLSIAIQAPSIAEQEKIANILNSIDIEIEEQERKLGQAKIFKKALLQQMFV